EAIRIYEDEGLIERAAALEPVLLGALRELKGRHAFVHATRGLGLLAAIELALPAATVPVIAKRIEADRIHLHVRPAEGTILLSPPLCIAEADLLDGVARIERAIVASIGR